MATETDTPAAPKDPAVAKAELAKLNAEAAKLEADARAAETAAAKAAREEAEAATPSAIRRREAAAEKETAEARKDAAAARQQGIAAFIPDLNKIDRGSLEVKGDGALYGQALAHRALTRAAASIADAVVGASDVRRVLVTSDTALAAADAAYSDVTSAAKQLLDVAKAVLKETKPETTTIRKSSVGAAAAAAAGALPALLSLFSTRRTLTTGAVAIDDVAASAAVAGALKGKNEQLVVRHNDFRLVPQGTVSAQIDSLGEARSALVRRKLELEARRTSTEVDRTAASDQVAKLVERVGSNGSVSAELTALRETLDEKTKAHDEAAVDADLVSSCIGDIEDFLKAVRTVPEGGDLSPLAAAALQEELHDSDDDKRFSHVLLVKAQSGSTAQNVDDRPLWWKDKFTVIATVTVSYILVSVPVSDIVKAGNFTSTVTGKGKIGETPTLDP